MFLNHTKKWHLSSGKKKKLLREIWFFQPAISVCRAYRLLLLCSSTHARLPPSQKQQLGSCHLDLGLIVSPCLVLPHTSNCLSVHQKKWSHREKQALPWASVRFTVTWHIMRTGRKHRFGSINTSGLWSKQWVPLISAFSSHFCKMEAPPSS